VVDRGQAVSSLPLAQNKFRPTKLIKNLEGAKVLVLEHSGKLPAIGFFDRWGSVA
jgi:hypothetical protein